MQVRNILEGYPDGVLLLGEVFEDCNEQACQLLQVQRDALLGCSLVDFFPARQPDGRESAAVLHQYSKAAFSGSPQLFQWQVCLIDGLLLDLEVSLKAVQLDDRQLLLLCMRDCGEANLHKSQNRYKIPADVAPVGIFHTDHTGKFLYVNDRWCDITGFLRKEALEKGLAWGIHVEDRDRVLKEWCDAVEQNRSFQSEYRMVHTNGTIFWIYAQVVAEKGEHGEGLGYLGIITDITERKKTEEALEKRNKFIETILNNLPVGLAVITWECSWNKRLIIYENNKMEQILGIPKSALRTVEDFFKIALPEPERREAVKKKSGATWSKRNATIKTTEYEITKPSGEKAIIFLWDIPLVEQRLMIVTAQDVTAQRQAEDEIHKLNRELEARVIERTRELEHANRELESFSYSVSHDLRAPLRAIDGFSEALLEDYSDKLDEQGKTYLSYLQEGSRDMSDLIDGLLKLSRSTRGEMSRENIDLSGLVRSVVDELQQAEPERQVTLVVAENIKVDADPRLLKVVMENLLGNAWKYTGKTPAAMIEFGIEEQGDETVYFVRDNGAGFDMAYVDKLFLPFHRLHKTDEFTGIGIGLATVQRIIHRHGGKLWAQGGVGEGACFYFTLREERSEHG